MPYPEYPLHSPGRTAAPGRRSPTAPSTATTGDDGEASVAVDANTIAGTYTITAAIGQDPASFDLTNDAGAPASQTAVSGSGQDATVGTAFESQLAVLVQDQYGNPVPGVTVDFTGPDGGAGAAFPDGATAITGDDGVARETVDADTVAGSYVITAAVGEVGGVTFHLTNDPGGPATLEIVEGSGLDATVATALDTPLAVLVQDQYGNPVPGVSVAFSGPESGAGATFPGGATATTGADGVAREAAVANTVAGAYTVTASLGELGSVSFDLTNDFGAPATLTVVGGSGQDTTVGTEFDAPLAVLVRDQYGNPVSGVTVAFTGPASGAAVAFIEERLRDDDRGRTAWRRSPIAAGTVAGSYTIAAGVGDLAPADFALTNDPGPAASLSVVTSAPSPNDEQNPFDLTVRFLDVYGNTATGFRGTVHFSSDDPRASLPADYTFTADDAGVHTFPGVRLLTPGPETLLVTSSDLAGSAVVDTSDTAPTVVLNDAVVPVAVGTVMQSGGSFTDPDGSVWTATVDYGDGGGPQPLALTADKTFQLQHVYGKEGDYTVTVVVTDESGESSVPASFDVEAFVVGTNAPGVGVAKGAPGTVAVASAPGITGVLIRAASDVGDGFLLVTPLPGAGAATVTAAAPGGFLQTVFYDVRGVNLSADDVVTVTFAYPPDGVEPVLRYFDAASGAFVIVPTTVNLADHTVTAVFTGDSVPPVTGLKGTVFTITVTPAFSHVVGPSANAFPPVQGARLGRRIDGEGLTCLRAELTVGSLRDAQPRLPSRGPVRSGRGHRRGRRRGRRREPGCPGRAGGLAARRPGRRRRGAAAGDGHPVAVAVHLAGPEADRPQLAGAAETAEPAGRTPQSPAWRPGPGAGSRPVRRRAGCPGAVRRGTTNGRRCGREPSAHAGRRPGSGGGTGPGPVRRTDGKAPPPPRRPGAARRLAARGRDRARTETCSECASAMRTSASSWSTRAARSNSAAGRSGTKFPVLRSATCTHRGTTSASSNCPPACCASKTNWLTILLPEQPRHPGRQQDGVLRTGSFRRAPGRWAIARRGGPRCASRIMSGISSRCGPRRVRIAGPPPRRAIAHRPGARRKPQHEAPHPAAGQPRHPGRREARPGAADSADGRLHDHRAGAGPARRAAPGRDQLGAIAQSLWAAIRN